MPSRQDITFKTKNEAFEQAITQENCRIHKRTKKSRKEIQTYR